jgi:hypothetical protein
MPHLEGGLNGLKADPLLAPMIKTLALAMASMLRPQPLRQSASFTGFGVSRRAPMILDFSRRSPKDRDGNLQP